MKTLLDKKGQPTGQKKNNNSSKLSLVSPSGPQPPKGTPLGVWGPEGLTRLNFEELLFFFAPWAAPYYLRES